MSIFVGGPQIDRVNDNSVSKMLVTQWLKFTSMQLVQWKFTYESVSFVLLYFLPLASLVNKCQSCILVVVW